MIIIINLPLTILITGSCALHVALIYHTDTPTKYAIIIIHIYIVVAL